MNTQHLKNRIESKLTIAEANQSIKNARSKIGFTAEDRAFIKANGGKLGPWLEWKKSKNEAAKKSASLAKKPAPTSSATKPAPAASKPVTTAPAPAPKSTATKPVRNAHQMHGIEAAIFAHQNKTSTPSDPQPATGLDRAIELHSKSRAAAPKVAKVDVSGLSGLERAQAVHKAQADSRKK